MTDSNHPSKQQHKPLHSLSSIDKESLTAMCAVCGPTQIRRYIRDNKYTMYVCIEGNRQNSAAYRLAHPRVSRFEQRRATSHILSNMNDEAKTATCSSCGPVRIYIRQGKKWPIRVCWNAAKERVAESAKKRKAENLQFCDDYKLSRGCKTCGYRESAGRLQFHAPGRDHRADHIVRLMMLRQERLIQELEKYEVLCESCHNRVHAKPPTKPQRARKPLAFRSHTK